MRTENPQPTNPNPRTLEQVLIKPGTALIRKRFSAEVPSHTVSVHGYLAHEKTPTPPGPP